MPISGYIKLYRSILEWEWFTVPNTRDVFIYLLLIANHEPKTWKGMAIERGQAVTSYQKMAQALTMSQDEVRTAIRHLKHTGEITYKATSKFGVVTIKNYCDYQDTYTQTPMPATTQIPPESQSTPAQPPTQIPTNKNIRNKNKEIKKKDILKTPYNPPTDVFAEYAGDDTELLTALRDFEKMRKKIKRPLTDKAKKLLTGKLDKLSANIRDKARYKRECLSNSILNSWQGVFPLNDFEDSREPVTPQEIKPDAPVKYDPDKMDWRELIE